MRPRNLAISCRSRLMDAKGGKSCSWNCRKCVAYDVVFSRIGHNFFFLFFFPSSTALLPSRALASWPSWFSYVASTFSTVPFRCWYPNPHTTNCSHFRPNSILSLSHFFYFTLKSIRSPLQRRFLLHMVQHDNCILYVITSEDRARVQINELKLANHRRSGNQRTYIQLRNAGEEFP